MDKIFIAKYIDMTFQDKTQCKPAKKLKEFDGCVELEWWVKITEKSVHQNKI